MNEDQANIHLINTVRNYYKQILITAILFFIISLGISLLMDKKYSAMGVVYPTKSNQMKNVVDDPGFGYQIHTDRLIQLLKSQTMQNEMVKRFQLIEYYELDTLTPNWVHKLNSQFKNDISINHTKYLSVEIHASFKSPELAANVVNNMISYVDTLRRDIFLENTVIWVNDLQPKIAPQQKIVDSLLLEITQSSTQGKMGSLSENTIAQIEKRKENGNQQYGDDIIRSAIEENSSIQLEKLISEYYMQLGVLNRYKSNLIAAQEKLNLPFPKIYTVMKAQVDDKKTSPSLRVNGLIGLCIGLLFGIVFYATKEQFSQISNKNSHA